MERDRRRERERGGNGRKGRKGEGTRRGGEWRRGRGGRGEEAQGEIGEGRRRPRGKAEGLQLSAEPHACHTVSHGASSHCLPLFLYQRLLISDSLTKPSNWWRGIWWQRMRAEGII